MSRRFVLDACSVIAYFRNENGAKNVIELLDEAAESSSIIFMHMLNYYEVYYDFAKEADPAVFIPSMTMLKSFPIRFVNNISDFLIEEATKFKLTYSISVADSFALATAKIKGAKLVTSDHHEFDDIDKNNEMQFVWIR